MVSEMSFDVIQTSSNIRTNMYVFKTIIPIYACEQRSDVMSKTYINNKATHSRTIGPIHPHQQWTCHTRSTGWGSFSCDVIFACCHGHWDIHVVVLNQDALTVVVLRQASQHRCRCRRNTGGRTGHRGVPYSVYSRCILAVYIRYATGCERLCVRGLERKLPVQARNQR